MSEEMNKTIKKKAVNHIRPFEKIPIFVVEDHNDVLQFIYRCLGARRIPFTNNKIIHFDSHPDMTIPKNLPVEYVKDKEKLLNALSIENWLMPVAYAGHIDQLIWMKPQWANQIDDGNFEFRIGDFNGHIRCDSPLEYFLSEATYQPRYNLNNQRLINLGVYTLNESLLGDDAEHLNEFRRVEFQNCVDEANEQFILDIDLDFFSTANPFKKILNKGVYENIKRLFTANFFEKKIVTEDELKTFTQKRSNYLDTLEDIFQQLEQNVEENDLIFPESLCECKTQIFNLICDIKQQHPNNEIGWMTIFDAGCTFDSKELPHHISTEEEIIQLIAIFKRFLESFLYKPSIITISRSSEDDYCPAEQVELIQKLVIEAIYDVYGERIDKKPILYYKDEEWTV